MIELTISKISKIWDFVSFQITPRSVTRHFLVNFHSSSSNHFWQKPVPYRHLSGDNGKEIDEGEEGKSDEEKEKSEGMEEDRCRYRFFVILR